MNDKSQHDKMRAKAFEQREKEFARQKHELHDGIVKALENIREYADDLLLFDSELPEVNDRLQKVDGSALVNFIWMTIVEMLRVDLDPMDFTWFTDHVATGMNVLTTDVFKLIIKANKSRKKDPRLKRVLKSFRGNWPKGRVRRVSW